MTDQDGVGEGRGRRERGRGTWGRTERRDVVSWGKTSWGRKRKTTRRLGEGGASRGGHWGVYKLIF